MDTEKAKNDFIKIYADNLCNVTLSCKKANIDRSTYYEWCNSDADFKKRICDAQEIQKDFGESKLMELINKGDTSATIFFMKTKCKDRGYTERQEITGADGNPIVQPVAYTTEQLIEMQKQLGNEC